MKPDLKIIYILLSVLIGFSCISEIEEPYTGTVQEEDRIIHLRIWLPSNSTGSQSRSITATEENYISSLYILSFSMDGNTEKFDYWTKGAEKDDNANGSPIQDYSAVLKVRNHRQRLVLLANPGEEIKQQIEQNNWKDLEKEVILALLDEDTPLDHHSLPMWGESIPETITTTTLNLTATIPLLRMVAKIDVQVDESVTGLTDKFSLRSVRLYNTNTKGKLVPARENIEDITVNGNRTITVKTPTIPADIAAYDERYLGPVIYEDFSPHGKENIAIRNAIYLFEVAAATAPLEATCLVIGGIYEADSNETYYRVDLLKENGNVMHDILRNYRYTINITDVKQKGHNDPTSAFQSKAENINISILEWNEADMDDIWFDSQYYYSVSPRNVEYNRNASTGNKIKIKTDYPEWSYELSGSSWINVTSHQAGAKYPGTDTPAYIEYNIAENNSSIPRTAYLHITAGRVTMIVVVNQTNQRIVAKNILPGTMNWPTAMGISSVYLNRFFFNSYDGDSSNENYNPDPDVYTGCAGYSEAPDQSDRGKWRLPTFDEMKSIAANHGIPGSFPYPGGIFWTSYETTSAFAMTYGIPTNQAHGYQKTQLMWVRCVK